MLKTAVIVAAVAITLLCGVQLGWMVTHGPAVTQVSDPSAAPKGHIIQTNDGGGEG